MRINRRTIFLGALASVSGLAGGIAEIQRKPDVTPSGTATIGRDIPVIWAAPGAVGPSTPLVIWLAPGISAMDETLPELRALAANGYLALSFDSWGRGSRTKDTMDQFFPVAMANWPFYGWPLLGNGALEALRVVDWAATQFGVEPPFSIGGVSAGGDLAVAAAGLDRRFACVAAANATPDWLRPGMHVGGRLVPPGAPDSYAQYLYDRINPLTNLSSYAHRPAINFECGAGDTHVPPDGALRFQKALAAVYAGATDRLRVKLHPGRGHEFTPAMRDNCIAWLRLHRSGNRS